MSQLKEIEGRYFKECNVVMLPTNKPANGGDRIWYNKYNKEYHLIYGAVKPNGNYLPQHLYITSDDEIKQSDWYLYYMNPDGIPELMQCRDKDEAKRCNDKTRSIGQISFKIIATTDKSLTIKIVDKETCRPIESGIMHKYKKKHLPQPSQSFIKKYCELGGIDKVLVEYIDNITCKTTGICKLYSSNTDKVCIGACNKSQLKTDSYNTITIKSVKDSWSREEIIEFKTAADAIINSASDVLGKNYDNDYDNYFKVCKKLGL